MRKLMFLLFFSLGVALLSVNTASAQVDSTCQIFGAGGNANIPQNTTKRFYTKYVPGAVYNWTITGGNISISGPRNLHYVDINGVECGPAQVCVSYSIDGQPPCCQCINVTVTGCTPPPPSCCIQYVNVTYDYLAPGGPVLKIKFKDCNPAGSGIVTTKLFISGVLHETQNWGSPINPNYTYNHNIRYPGCEQIYCITICGYNASGTLLCCTSVKGVGITCSGTYDPAYGQPIEWPTSYCSGGGGGGLPIDKTAPVKSKLSLTPNPATNTVTVSFPEKNNINTIQLVDRSGNLIRTYYVKGKNVFTIPVMNLKTGNYIIKPDNPLVESAIFIKQ